MCSSSSSSTASNHVRTLFAASLAVRALVAVLVAAASTLPLFDASPSLISSSPLISSLLRWDAFHFAHIAQNGPVFEYEWAFLPGISLAMRIAANFFAFLARSPSLATNWDALLVGGALLAAACDCTRVMYKLSLHHLRSPSLAFLSTMLSLLPSSTAALRFASYSEPFFAYFSYSGMLYCAQSQWVPASVCFALAGTFRSNGIFLSGFLLWGMVVDPFVYGQYQQLSPVRLLYSALLTAIPFTPFVYHNFSAYMLFCTAPRVADWCSRPLPSVYSYVQEKYWNSGFLLYWTVSQLPNFIISLPVLLNILFFATYYIHHTPVISIFFASTRTNTSILKSHPSHDPATPFLTPSLLPHVLYSLALTLLLIFSAHTQISLRVLPTAPLTYWAAARLLVDHPAWGRAWVVWSVVWGVLSAVLWAVFLPPA